MKSLKFVIAYMLLVATALFSAVGEMKISNGDVTIERDGKSIKGACNAQIEEKDIITTKTRANAKVVFSDGTAISLGANTNFKVHEYLYDEASSKANLKVSISEGAFKAVTGRIGKISPDKFKLETKTATMGIRGTRFLGNVPKDGPDTIACTEGVITVAPLMSKVDGQTPPEPIEVKAGEITKVSPGVVETPRKYTPAEIRKVEFSAGRSCDCK